MNRPLRISQIVYSLLLCASLATCACTKSGGGGDEESSNDDQGEDLPGTSFALQCGIVQEGALQRNVNTSDATFVEVTKVIAPNLVILREMPSLIPGEESAPSGSVLFKIQGVSSDGVAKKAAQTRVSELVSGGAYMFSAGAACEGVPLPGGGLGVIGSLVTFSGLSVAEELVSSGLIEPDTMDACGGESIGSCLASISGSNQETAGEVGEFLWKPVSDSNGRLAIHTGPPGTVVSVNGETGTNQGGGNGFGSLARFSKPGGSYGSNVIVNVRDEFTGLPYTLNGEVDIIIPNGSQRYCATAGGGLFACVKN